MPAIIRASTPYGAQARPFSRASAAARSKPSPGPVELAVLVVQVGQAEQAADLGGHLTGVVRRGDRRLEGLAASSPGRRRVAPCRPASSRRRRPRRPGRARGPARCAVSSPAHAPPRRGSGRGWPARACSISRARSGLSRPAAAAPAPRWSASSTSTPVSASSAVAAAACSRRARCTGVASAGSSARCVLDQGERAERLAGGGRRLRGLDGQPDRVDVVGRSPAPADRPSSSRAAS